MTKLTRFIVSWMPILLLLANLYLQVGNSPILFHLATYSTGLLGLFLMISDKRLNRRILWLFFLFYALTLILGWCFNGNNIIWDVTRSIAMYGVFVVLLSFPTKYYQGLLLLYVSIIFFIMKILSGELYKEILGVSGNYISVILILFLSVCYIGLKNSKKRLSLFDLLTVTIIFLISVWAHGRGGIVATGFLLISILFLYLQSNHYGSSLSKYSTYIILSLVVTYFVWYFFEMYEDILTLDKFVNKGIDGDGREDLWLSYWDKMTESPIYFLFGAPLHDIADIRVFDDNPHNSFVQLHAFNGLFFFIFFFAIMLKSMILYCKRNMLFAIMIMAIVIRGMTDVFIFGNYGMAITFYFIMLPYGYSRYKMQYENKLR